jgi:dihydrofolate reductase
MAKLIYIANTSLDGYTEDRDGDFNWGAPDEEYFRSINSLQRQVGTYLYGRRMYEAMVYWRPHLSLTSRPGSQCSPTSGERPGRSCIRRPWSHRQAAEQPLRARSTSRRSGR